MGLKTFGGGSPGGDSADLAAAVRAYKATVPFDAPRLSTDVPMIETLTVTATGGTFKIQRDVGFLCTTAAINASGISAAAINAALAAATPQPIPGTAVANGGGVFTITTHQQIGFLIWPDLFAPLDIVNNTVTGGTATIATTQEGVAVGHTIVTPSADGQIKPGDLILNVDVYPTVAFDGTTPQFDIAQAGPNNSGLSGQFNEFGYGAPDMTVPVAQDPECGLYLAASSSMGRTLTSTGYNGYGYAWLASPDEDAPFFVWVTSDGVQPTTSNPANDPGCTQGELVVVLHVATPTALT